MQFPRTFQVEFRRRIDGELTKMCPLGTALGVLKICTDIKKQSHIFAVEKYGFLQNLKLTNQGHSESTNIDLLIGSDT